jgi:hypothetical protein
MSSDLQKVAYIKFYINCYWYGVVCVLNTCFQYFLIKWVSWVRDVARYGLDVWSLILDRSRISPSSTYQLNPSNGYCKFFPPGGGGGLNAVSLTLTNHVYPVWRIKICGTLCLFHASIAWSLGKRKDLPLLHPVLSTLLLNNGMLIA